MTITPSKSFAIYQTQKGIELLTNQAKPTDADLICIVSHYQSAVRIARKAAQIRQEPLATNGS
jgi:ribosome-binding protein aMBF1 (putative translation factor)